MNIKTLYITIDRVISVLCIFIAVSIYACSSDDDILHTVMKDGNKLTISGQITYYDTEDTFLHSVSSYPINITTLYTILITSTTILMKVMNFMATIKYSQGAGKWQNLALGYHNMG